MLVDYVVDGGVVFLGVGYVEMVFVVVCIFFDMLDVVFENVEICMLVVF